MDQLLLTLMGPVKFLTAMWLFWWLVKRLWHEYYMASKDPTCDAPLPPGSVGLPIVGETLAFFSQGSKYYEDKFRIYGRLFMTHLLGKATVRVRGSDNLHKILHGEDEIVSFQYPKTITNILGKHTLVQARGQNHVILRKRMTSAFTHAALEGYLPLITDKVRDAIRKWCGQPNTNTFRAMQELVCQMNVSVLCGFHYDEDEISEITGLIYDIDKGIIALPINLPGTAYRKAIEAGRKLREKIASSLRMEEKLSSETDKRALEAGQKLREKIASSIQMKAKLSPEADKPDCLRKLMDSDESYFGDNVDFHEIVADNAFDLLVLGFGTLSSACTSVVLHLSKNPAAVERIKEELESAGLADPNVPIIHSNIGALHYVNYVVKEILRLSPPVTASFRKVVKTFVLDGMQIPAGWTVLFSIKDTMTFSEHYKDSDLFDPERFGPGRREDKQGGRYNFPVFGGGQRACPGKFLAMMILQILVIELVRLTRWELLEPDNIRIQTLPVPHPVGGLPVKFTSIIGEEEVDENQNTKRVE